MNKTEMLKQIEILKKKLASLDKTHVKKNVKASTFHWPPPRECSYIYKIDGKVIPGGKEGLNAVVKSLMGKDWIPSFETYGYYPLPKECKHSTTGKVTHDIKGHKVSAERVNL